MNATYINFIEKEQFMMAESIKNMETEVDTMATYNSYD
jgi:hypothetical protein